MIRNVYKLYHVVNFFLKIDLSMLTIYCIETAVQVSDVAYETLVYVNSVDILKLAFLVNRQEVGC